MTFGQLVRGIDDLAVYPLDPADDSEGSAVDVFGARSLEWSTTSDSDEIEGDDLILATAYSPKSGSGSLTHAGASLTGMAAMLGVTAVAAGTTPNATVTVAEDSAANQTYVAIKGQALGADTAGSAFQVTLHKAKVGGISESLENGSWLIPSLDFTFVQNQDGDFITRVLQETRVALA
jgi:hypothetical protein